MVITLIERRQNMICKKCKNENREQADNCWNCSTSFRNERGERINVETCPRCGSDNLTVTENESGGGSGGCISAIVICIAAVAIGKYLSVSGGEQLFGLGVAIALLSLVAGIVSMFRKTTDIKITCNDCHNVYDSEQAKDK